MIRLALLVLLLATANCSPTSKRSWSGPGPDKNDDHPLAVKPEDKEESNLDLGEEYTEDEKDNLDDDKKDEVNLDDNLDLGDYHDKNTDNKDEDDKNSNKDKDDEKDKFNTEISDLTEEVTETPANISVEYGSGKDVIEGDIKLTPEQAAIFKRGGWDELVNSEAWLRNHGKWSRTIPYTISGVATRERNALTNSIKMFHDLTCLRFTPKLSYNRDYIQFVSRGGCWSYLGKRPGSYARPQLVSLASGCHLAVPAHEIMHALGRFHEQSRADRDRYVRIITGNISTCTDLNII
ncbi:PREDICTED: blastula protease 10-like [Amphimedon queenslandica]|uniref:Metalloendopeptidase n=1 Tax=Amphimedon queenslandica TaxID=400682 RepID=A0AAN0J207_AMPQE|nr:PREDICTED: blastula protease 10-like [Amphimedon queenslandica]|eukprot:XP_019851035.1 PREDICTED: blastula protease 10-like [Amphimedon queenslandica]